MKMHPRTVLLFLLCVSITLASSQTFSFEKVRSYVNYFRQSVFSVNETENELWHGIFKDCDRRVTFSCIQKNAYTYLDNTFEEKDNITVFDGLVLTKNNLDYGSCVKKNRGQENVEENLVEDSNTDDECREDSKDEEDNEDEQSASRQFVDERTSPLEEITGALRRKTVKFLATRNYDIQLPSFFFEGATMKISPREVDESGALLRVDFGQGVVDNQGRVFFKKIRRFIQNKLLMSFLALLLIIKLIKVKFMFVIPFLFGIGAAKKLFLKLLLFFIPAFAHIFKLCSSYYTSHGTKYHHHHHQIAHHHHHVPVPVAIPHYERPHHHHHDDEFDGYDYAHPHIQYRKDMEELKEWGIEPYEEPYEVNSHLNPNSLSPGVAPSSAQGSIPGVVPGIVPGVVSNPVPSSYALPQYPPNVRQLSPAYQDKQSPSISAQAHNLAYSGYLEDNKLTRRGVAIQPTLATAPANPGNMVGPTTLSKVTPSIQKNLYTVFTQQNSRAPGQVQGQRVSGPTAAASKSSVGSVGTVLVRQAYDDEYYGPIIARLEEIFGQLRFYEEACRERLICSMYKSPALYSPHSNLVSNELSRDPQELKRSVTGSASGQRFHRYLSAARLGQDGGDCLRAYPCHINTE